MEYGGSSGGLTNLPYTDMRGLHSTNRQGHEDAPVTRNQPVMRDGGGESHGLLCPFYVRDRNTWRRCFERSLRNAADVRHHIQRVHMQEYCQSCGTSNEECLGLLPSCRPGVTKAQFDDLKPHSREADSATKRWERIWKVIFPNEAVPDCAFASGETVFVQRLLDIRNIINSEQWKNLDSAPTWTNPGPFELSVIDQLIETARYLEQLPDGTMPQISDPTNLVLGEGGHASPSSSSEPAGTQLGGCSTLFGPAGAPFQKGAPTLGPASESEGLALKKECLYNQASTRPTGFQTPLPGGQFQYHGGISPGLDANELSLSFDIPGEQSPLLNGSSNQLTTHQAPCVYNPLDALYLVDPWPPGQPL